jgi:hypothetical protein
MMSDPKDRVIDDPRRPSPPEIDLEPIPLPDESGAAPMDDDPLDGGRVPAIPSRDEANIDPDEALPDDTEEAILHDDPEREDIRFDEVSKSSR